MKFYKVIFLLSLLMLSSLTNAMAQEKNTQKPILSKELTASLKEELKQRLEQDPYAKMAQEVLAYAQYCKILEEHQIKSLHQPLLNIIPKKHSEDVVLYNSDIIPKILHSTLHKSFRRIATIWLTKPSLDMVLSQQKYIFSAITKIGPANINIPAWTADYIQKATSITFPAPYCERLKPKIRLLENWLKDQDTKE